MANEVVNRRLNVYIDAAGAEEALTRLTKKEAELTKQIDNARAAGKDFTKEMQRLGETRTQISNLQGVISGKMLPSVRQAEAAVSKLRRELRSLPSDSEAAARKFQDFKRAEATLKAVREQAFGAGQALNSIGKGRGLAGFLDTAKGVFLGGGALAAITSVGSFLKKFFSGAITEALEAEKAVARFAATLDYIGRSDVFERLKKSADEFASVFGYLDNDEIIGVFEKLVTYGKLTERQINQLTPVIIDFAAKSQTDLATATEVVIKALEGNGKALKQYGIDIKDAKDQSEAFGIIMDQLKPKVDGAAQAFGETTQGQIQKTRQEIKNLQEDIGTQLLPAVKAFFQGVSGITEWVNNLITKGSIFDTETQLGADIRAKSEFYDELVKEFSNETKYRQALLLENQRALLVGMDAEYQKASGKRKTDIANEIRKERALWERYRAIFDIPDNVLNDNGGGESEEERRKREEEAKKRAKELDDLRKKYKEFADTIRGEQLDAEFGEIFAAFRKINEAAEADLAKLDEFRKKGIVKPDDYQQLVDAIGDILDAQREELQKKFGLNPLKVTIEPVLDPDAATAELDASAPNNPLKTLTRQLGLMDREATAKLQLDIMQSSGRRRLELQKQQLQEEMDEELRNTELTESEKFIIKEEYRQKEIDLEREFWMQIADIVLQFASQFSDIIANIGQIRANREQEQLDKETASNEKRKDSAKKLLDAKAISQKEYDRRIAKIEADQEKRQQEFAKRQFERDKNAQTVQAIISGAQAALSTIARFGPPLPPNFLGIAAMALTVATSATQIAAIRSAKPPKFEEGGILPQGSSHRQGGISLIDNRTGQNVGEIEGGEPIISRKTYARNKGLIDALLSPSWKDAPVASINFPRINNSMQSQRYFAEGGFLPQATDTQGLSSALGELNDRLSRPLRAFVVYNDIETKGNKINGIRNAGIMR